MSPASPMRKRMAGLLHLDTNPSEPRSPMSPSSPLLSKGGRSHRLYQKLDDGPYTDWSNEETYHTGKPASALISPWSPSEYEFPYPTLHSPGSDSVFASDPRTPCTPPPLYPPPPAYIREVPMRSPLSAPNTPTRAVGPYVAEGLPESPPPPTSPVVTTLTREIAHDIDAWSVVRTLREGIRGAPDEDAFVITNDSEDEDLGSSIAHGSFESV
ncbi:hypothetical protein BD413DRAFT_580949 [Trametes elegans]|nr:hypothetical protein BD413DRAFT_580949 [Trametes elegans]